jgi:hypothetical protein
MKGDTEMVRIKSHGSSETNPETVTFVNEKDISWVTQHGPGTSVIHMSNGDAIYVTCVIDELMSKIHGTDVTKKIRTGMEYVVK